MNCKQGDMAIVVGGSLGNKSRNLGKIVTCLRLLPAWSFPDDFGPVWELDQPLYMRCTLTGEELPPDNISRDVYLRPFLGDLTNDDVDTQINREAETC